MEGLKAVAREMSTLRCASLHSEALESLETRDSMAVA